MRLRDIDNNIFKESREIYEVSFPVHEQRELKSQQTIMLDDEYHYTVYTSDDSIDGLALYWETDTFIYVEHLCVNPEKRGDGIGSMMLQNLGKKGKIVILEIDPLVDEVSIRRKGFYERNGFALNPYKHVHPPYHEGNNGHDLIIMTHPRAISQGEYDAFNAYLIDRVMSQ